MSQKFELRVGAILPSTGAEVVRFKSTPDPKVALIVAHWKEKKEWVTWKCYLDSGECFLGHYFTTETEAWADHDRRY